MNRILHTSEILYSPNFDQPKVKYGLLVDESGTILEVAPSQRLLDACDERHDHQVIMPGVVNAHIHLTDAGRSQPVPGGEGLVSWIRNLMDDRSAGLTDPERLDVVGRTIHEMREKGTVAFGEVANNEVNLVTIQQAGVRCRFIHELIGGDEERAQEIIDGADRIYQEKHWNANVAHAVGAHAPYSVSIKLMKLIAERSAKNNQHFYQHLAEDPAERDLYERGEGSWVDFLKNLGVWQEGSFPIGLSPIPLYDSLGLLTDRFVAVHLADATHQEIQLLASRGVKVILSPTSNLHITGLLPPVRVIVEAGMKIALGTDGRGSNSSMDVFDEARLLYQHFPDLPSGTLLRALTVGGADILNFSDLGDLCVGSNPGLISIETSNTTSDLRRLELAILDASTAKRMVYQ